MGASRPFEKLHGVPLDPDQRKLLFCGFEDCEGGEVTTGGLMARARSDRQVLYLVVNGDEVCGVCEKCYRTKLRRGDPKPQ